MNGWTFHTTTTVFVGDCILIGYGDNVFHEVISVEKEAKGCIVTALGLERPVRIWQHNKARIARPPKK